MRTRSQRLAAKIYEQVAGVQTESFAADYGRVCMRFPSLVLRDGLQATLAFFRSKAVKKEEFKQFLEHLRQVLENDAHPDAQALREVDRFLDKVRTTGHLDYMVFTRTALLAAQWYKRYSEAILKADLTEEEAQA